MIALRLPAKINLALLLAMVAITFVFAAFIYPLETKRTEDQIERVRVLMDTIYKQKKNDFANAIFADQHLAILANLHEVEEIVEEIDNACLYTTSGSIRYCAKERQPLPDVLLPLQVPMNEYQFRQFSGKNREIGVYLNSIKLIGEDVGYLAVYYNLSRITGGNKNLMLLSSSLFISGLLVITLLLNFFLYKAIINPLYRLRDGMRSVTSGNLGELVPYQSQDEIGEMAATFNEMSHTLLDSREEIHRYHLHLEDLVRERTRELQKAKEHAERAEEKQRGQWEILRIIMETIPNPMFYKDINGRYTGCNVAFENFVGISRDKLIGKTVYDIVDKKYADRYTEEDRRILENPGTQNYDWRVKGKNGDIREVTFSKATITDEHGAVVGLVGIITDVTDLVRAREQAELANSAKSQFLANMSHEIRTPMNGVIGMTTLLNDTELDSRQKEYVGIIRTSAESLLRIINDILDYSRIEAGKLLLRRYEFELVELLEECYDLLKTKAHEKKIAFRYDYHSSLPQKVAGDRDRLKQVLINLSENAIKFTEHGEVVVFAEKLEDVNGKVVLRFTVRDSGIGIAKEQQAKLFESFSQVDGSYTRKFGGTGLGLAISKELVRLLGGEITLESEVDKGSSFIFTVRLDKVSEKAVSREDNIRGIASRNAEMSMLPDFKKALSVLLVEDNPINMQVATGILYKLGYENIHTAVNGEEALNYLSANYCDLVLMDLSMPERDGFATTYSIRSNEHKVLNPSVPIIALTAHAMRGDRERCLAAGMNGYLSKPLDPVLLQQAIEAVFPRSAQSSMAAGNGDSSPDNDLSSALDYPLFLKRLMGDEQMAVLILEEGLKELPVQLQKLDSLIESGEISEAARQAHKLKGAVANISAHRLHHLFRTMEDAARNENLEEMKALLPKVYDGMGHLRQAVVRLSSPN